MKKLFTFLMLTLAFSFASTAQYADNFDSYDSGQKLVQQALAGGITHWTCWTGNGGAGGAEDPMITADQALSAPNAVVCSGTNDFVALFGDQTEGKHIVSFDVYVPTGFVGYFNLLQVYGEGGAGAVWGSEVYFNPNGTGSLNANGSAGFKTFSYAYDTWFHVENIVDLNADQASLIVAGTEIATWKWSLGASGSGVNKLAAMDIFAAATNGSPKCYFDNMKFSQATSFEIFDDLETYNANEKLVQQALAQGIEHWTCWTGNGGAGGAEDPMVTTDQAASGANSIICEGTNDFVMLFGNKTSGKYAVSFDVFVPTGFVGYYNLLQVYGEGGAGAVWGSEVYFNPNATASINANGTAGYATFGYPYNTWIHIDNIVDLNADQASLMVEGAEVASWKWSLGASGSGVNQLAAMDIFAAATNGTPKCYFDNFTLENFAGLPAPTNLSATVLDNDVTLQWNAPSGDIIGYNVYRDGVMIAEKITPTTYVDLDLLPNYYMYDVKAVYDEGISAGAGPIEVYIEGGTERKMVLVEIGTGTWCPYCPGAALGADDLIENGHNVAVIEYHNNDNYATPQTDYRNGTYYNITGFPTAFFDGVISHVGGNNSQSLYQTYLPSYEERAAKMSLFEMDLNVVNSGTNAVDAYVSVDNIYPYSGNNIVLHVVITESEIAQNWQGQTELNFVCRKMYPDQFGTAMNFSSQPTYEGTFAVDIAGYVKDNCEIVVFLQDNTTKEVLQAQKFDLEDIVGINENPVRRSVSIYPNPANSVLNITAEKSMTAVKIMNHLGQIVLNRETTGTNFSLNVADFAPGIYFVKVITGQGTLTEKIVVE
ncbi:MAG TPA: T9SS type A sorting domain-containing protein [Bacteroidales bacterium]|nr:T9SS type A sorting domain-containing protein [Bacteroidales bacterium]